ncbi:MAG: spore coat protein CotJB [Oscillospiraceae bacterium]|jgi:spore coat protein JB|nr:spore coat protein CotJB [Oscillospiraceae bacterium]MDD3260529.1 spore coat protein CotJB [Oscillospiraceae bacterium]
MTEQQRLMRKICAGRFAIWELKIFLDTHPDNCDAVKRLEEYQKQTAALIEQYEKEYGPLNQSDAATSRWAWVQEPWPWETQEQKEAKS